MCAVAAWQRHGGLPVKVVVVADGAEEVGSPGYAAAARRLARAVQPHAAVVSTLNVLLG
jgi:succinyl-diaminopimelate desuccinylase